jgi:hypothetical protein
MSNLLYCSSLPEEIIQEHVEELDSPLVFCPPELERASYQAGVLPIPVPRFVVPLHLL